MQGVFVHTVQTHMHFRQHIHEHAVPTHLHVRKHTNLDLTKHTHTHTNAHPNPTTCIPQLIGDRRKKSRGRGVKMESDGSLLKGQRLNPISRKLLHKSQKVTSGTTHCGGVCVVHQVNIILHVTNTGACAHSHLGRYVGVVTWVCMLRYMA